MITIMVNVCASLKNTLEMIKMALTIYSQLIVKLTTYSQLKLFIAHYILFVL
jgi:hypothetical protein